MRVHHLISIAAPLSKPAFLAGSAGRPVAHLQQQDLRRGMRDGLEGWGKGSESG